jgi:hypothetical protein
MYIDIYIIILDEGWCIIWMKNSGPYKAVFGVFYLSVPLLFRFISFLLLVKNI